ncbi:Carbonic anhydrase [Colletotrichum tanaceti]|uniref:Carbonic anhydrase n=1 Tax=Colletotrichum tanaceti TaxID=1306861 RepID=A0A4U6X137_9PEZI|nr:Carbonic anhydrase [Colletotrichum tanaceti]TKW48449.1 Carbonic anhydrase [Colletotrichum tanaceti]
MYVHPGRRKGATFLHLGLPIAPIRQHHLRLPAAFSYLPYPLSVIVQPLSLCRSFALYPSLSLYLSRCPVPSLPPLPKSSLMFKARPVPRSLALFSPSLSPSFVSLARLALPRPIISPRDTLHRQLLHQHNHNHLQQTSSFSHIAHRRTSSDKLDPKMADQDIEHYLKQTHDRVFENNRRWAEEKKKQDPNFFVSLSEGQSPEYLWIGCSDSRIPAEQITGLEPGEAFIHRNIANMVNNIDLNVMSVINYAVRHLQVKHIVVCGHYGCGGVKAAMTPKDLGLLNPWLRNIRDVYRLHEAELDAIADEDARYNRLVELNVVEQCRNVIKTAAIQQSYAKNKFPIVHGWVFGFHDGLLKDLKIDHKSMLHDIQKLYHLPGADF